MTTAKKTHGASPAHSNRINVRLPSCEWEMFKRKAAAEGKEPNALLMEIIFDDIQQRTPAKPDAHVEPLAASYAPRRRLHRHIPFREWQMFKHDTRAGKKLRSALRFKIRQRSSRCRNRAGMAAL